MNVIYAKNIWDNNNKIQKKDLINEFFDCEIFINNIAFSNNMNLNKNNDIYIKLKKNYEDFSSMFYDCKSLIAIDLSNINTNNITNMSGNVLWL